VPEEQPRVFRAADLCARRQHAPRTSLSVPACRGCVKPDWKIASATTAAACFA
jgi:hypothetical protein